MTQHDDPHAPDLTQVFTRAFRQGAFIDPKHIDPTLPPALRRARWLAWLLDYAVTIPVIKQKIGLDPVLSAIPWGGDLLMLGVSAYMFWVAWRLKMPRNVFLGILANIAVDYAIGLIPLLGDLADIGWKANSANVDLIEETYRERLKQARENDSTPVIDVEAVRVR